MKEKHVVISKGNSKMRQIQSVSLPPIVTCSPLAYKFCGKKCYARKMCKFRKQELSLEEYSDFGNFIARLRDIGYEIDNLLNDYYNYEE